MENRTARCHHDQGFGKQGVRRGARVGGGAQHDCVHIQYEATLRCVIHFTYSVWEV